MLSSITEVSACTPEASIAYLLLVEMVFATIVTFLGILFKLNFSIKTPTPESEVILLFSTNRPVPSSFS